MSKGTISVGVGFKKNLGNFQMFDVHVNMTVEVDDTYDDAEWAKAWDKVEIEMEKRLSNLDG